MFQADIDGSIAYGLLNTCYGNALEVRASPLGYAFADSDFGIYRYACYSDPYSPETVSYAHEILDPHSDKHPRDHAYTHPV